MKQWLQDGLKGLTIFGVLLLFYLTIYNYLLDYFFPDGAIPTYALLLPIVSGHILILFSHFFVEGLSLPQLFGCETTNCYIQVELYATLGLLLTLAVVYFVAGMLVGKLWRRYH